ncbi:MAG: YqgE/AlgH family protein [Nitrospirae bacterium]|nr:YqgE/AlgH family protein [Nitrospirota bacterium]
MDANLEKGIFLIATPSLRDPNFRQSVILLCEHGPDGALGVVVNRPTEIGITEVLPQVPILEGQDHFVYSGGPVQRNHLLILYRVPEEPQDTHHVFDGVYLGGNMDILERILKEPKPRQAFRAYMGYSGWAPGQLENEMELGSWLTLPADSTYMFDRDQSRLWGDILKSMGNAYDIYSDMPVDPSLN